MTWARGYQSQLLLAWETVYGSDPSTIAAWKLPFNTLDIGLDQPNQYAATIRDNRNPSMPFRGNKDVTGTLVVPMDRRSTGVWLRGLLGSPVTTGSTIPYTHTYKVGDTIPSFALDVGHTDIGVYYKYNGCKINTYGVTVGGDGELVANLGLIGASETKGTSAMDASPAVDHTAIATRFENFEAAATEGGSAIDYLTEMSFEINNNLVPAFCIGDAGIKSQLAEGMISVRGSITGLFQDDALLLKGRNFTESALSITITDTGNANYSIAYFFDELVFNYRKPPIPGPEGLMLSLDFEAYYQDDADASAVRAVLNSSTASYA